MHLENVEAVHDVNAGASSSCCPADIVLFVETGLQLEKNCDLLATVHSTAQRCRDGGVPSHSIEALFDGKRIWVGRGLVKKVNDDVKRVERVVEEDVRRWIDAKMSAAPATAAGTPGTNGSSLRSGGSRSQ